MVPSNAELAILFDDIADRCDVKGDENPFAIRAYRAVSETINGHPRAIADVWQAGGVDALVAIKGIGKEIAKKVDELMRTGKLDFYERLRVAVPDSVAAMLGVPGLGPKRVKQVWDALGVDSVEKLEAAARAGKLRELPKMGEKMESKILEGIAALRRTSTGRTPLGAALPIAEHMIEALRRLPQVIRIDYAGSLRRGRDTIGDVDLIVGTRDSAPVMAAFVALPGVVEVLGHGETKSSVRMQSGLQVDLRAVEPEVWGTAMQYFTGSQQHNIRMRARAQQQGWSLNEYALSPIAAEKGARNGPLPLQFGDEAGLYQRLGLPYIPPELREDRGEFDTPIPEDLITLGDLRGDLQMHTTWSDGAVDVMGMARAAHALGHAYALITDHSQGLGVVNGLTPQRMAEQRKEIERVNAQLRRDGLKITVLQGIEVEVLADGELGLPDDALAACDIVQASLHTSLTQPRAKITARAIKAISNPHIDILGHPSGRMLNQREGADYDWDALFACAAERRVAVEINCASERLDLSDVLAHRAVEAGCLLSISTDAHAPPMLAYQRLGVLTARRAWVRAGQVVNTWPLARLLKWAAR